MAIWLLIISSHFYKRVSIDVKTPDSEEKVRQSDLYLGLCTEVILVILGCQKVIPIFILWAPLTYHSHCPGGIACRLGARFNPLSQVWRPFFARSRETFREKAWESNRAKNHKRKNPYVTVLSETSHPFDWRATYKKLGHEKFGHKNWGTEFEIGHHDSAACADVTVILKILGKFK